MILCDFSNLANFQFWRFVFFQGNYILANSVENQYLPNNWILIWANVKLSTKRNIQWFEGFNVNNVWPASMSKPVYKDMCEVFMKKCDFFVTSVPNPSPICKIIRNINCLSMKALKDTPVKIVHWALKINFHWSLMMTLNIRRSGSSVQSVLNHQLHKIGWKSIWIHICNGNKIQTIKWFFKIQGVPTSFRWKSQICAKVEFWNFLSQKNRQFFFISFLSETCLHTL